MVAAETGRWWSSLLAGVLLCFWNKWLASTGERTMALNFKFFLRFPIQQPYLKLAKTVKVHFTGESIMEMPSREKSEKIAPAGKYGKVNVGIAHQLSLSLQEEKRFRAYLSNGPQSRPPTFGQRPKDASRIFNPTSVNRRLTRKLAVSTANAEGDSRRPHSRVGYVGMSSSVLQQMLYGEDAKSKREMLQTFSGMSFKDLAKSSDTNGLKLGSLDLSLYHVGASDRKVRL